MRVNDALRSKRLILAGSAILSAIAAIVVVGVVVLAPGRAPFVPYAPVPDASTEANNTVAHIWDVIHRDAVENNRLTDENAIYLKDAFDLSNDLYVQRWALAGMSSMYHAGVRMSEKADLVMRDAFRRALTDPNWRIRRCVVGCIQESGLLGSDEFYEVVRAMADDERSEVAARVRRIDWDAVAKERGG